MPARTVKSTPTRPVVRVVGLDDFTESLRGGRGGRLVGVVSGHPATAGWRLQLGLTEGIGPVKARVIPQKFLQRSATSLFAVRVRADACLRISSYTK